MALFLGGNSALWPIHCLFNGTTYVDFNYTISVPEVFQVYSGSQPNYGTWKTWLSNEDHPKYFRGADQKAVTGINASNLAFGSWMGPWR